MAINRPRIMSWNVGITKKRLNPDSTILLQDHTPCEVQGKQPPKGGEMIRENKSKLLVLKTVLKHYLIVTGVLAGFCLSVAVGGCGVKEESAVEKALRESERGTADKYRETGKRPEKYRVIGSPDTGTGGGGGGGGLGGDLDTISSGIGGLKGTGKKYVSPDADIPAVEGNPAFTDREVIKNAEVKIIVDDVDKALNEVEKVINSQGGELVTVNRRRYEDDDRCEVIARVPSDRFDSTMKSAEKIGEVVELLIEAEDVTEEYIDLQMRLDNQVEARDRFIEILNTRAGKLEDVISLQREINNTTENIERLTGKIRYLENRATFSTIFIALEKHATVTETSEETASDLTLLQDIIQALDEAFRALFNVVLFIVQAAIVLTPLVIVGLIAVLGVRRLYVWAYRNDILVKLVGRTTTEE